jgi:copper chaperone CopZ
MRLRDAVLGTMVVMLVGAGSMPSVAEGGQGKTKQTAVSTLRIPDMFCGGCEAAVKITAKKVEGVREVRTDSAKRTAEVTYDPAQTNAEAIAREITKNSGFKAEVVRKGKS